MGQADEAKEDVTRMRRITEEAEQEQGKKYSLWEKLAKIFEGDQERRDYSTRKPNP